MLGDDVACQLSYTEYDVVGKGYGGDGYSVRDIKNVKKVLVQALKTAREKKIPVCVNALIGSTDFREGSISVWFPHVNILVFVVLVGEESVVLSFFLSTTISKAFLYNLHTYSNTSTFHHSIV